MSKDLMEIQIAAKAGIGHIPADKPLAKRIASLEALVERMRPSAAALRMAKEFVANPDARAQVKVQLAMQHGMAISDMIDEAVVVARELLRIKEAK